MIGVKNGMALDEKARILKFQLRENPPPSLTIWIGEV